MAEPARTRWRAAAARTAEALPALIVSEPHPLVRRRLFPPLVALALVFGVSSPCLAEASASAQETTPPPAIGDGMDTTDLAGNVTRAEWRQWADAFLAPEGRVIDQLNGGISHSEGQGYGLMLAFAAGDGTAFDQIWSFTRDELRLRDDGLLAWRWDPAADPHVQDLNNASDGDILVALALVQAGRAWARPDLTAAGRDLVSAIAATVLGRHEDRAVLAPGADGFSANDRTDGPIVNPSYWIFEAFPLFAEIDPDADWRGLARDGLALIADLLEGGASLPPDWVSLRGGPRPAQGFDPVFGYNAMRIPLYLLRADIRDAALLAPLLRGMRSGGPGTLAVVDLRTGSVRDRLTDPGYRIQPALVACALDAIPIDAELRTFAPTTYYPSTLHLLALSYARHALTACL